MRSGNFIMLWFGLWVFGIIITPIEAKFLGYPLGWMFTLNIVELSLFSIGVMVGLKCYEHLEW